MSLVVLAVYILSFGDFGFLAFRVLDMLSFGDVECFGLCRVLDILSFGYFEFWIC